MITGIVTGDRQVIIHLVVCGPAGQEQEIEAIIDTGFDGAPRRIHVDEAEAAPLVGMSLPEGCELGIEVRPGGKVTIRQLSPGQSG